MPAIQNWPSLPGGDASDFAIAFAAGGDLIAVVGILLGVGGSFGSTGAAPEDLPGTSVGRNRPDDDEDDAAAEGIACCFLLSGITSVVFGSAVAGRAFGGTGGFFSVSICISRINF